jgi:hypothetical protein
VRSKSTAGKVVLVSSVTTWQAYNLWGGRSAYKDDEGNFSNRSRAVSFDRPHSKGKGSGGYLSYENPAVLLAEKLRIPLAYATSVDIATIPGYLDGARGYVSLGHDEYWTASERDAVETARDAGMNVAFLGANVSYWQVRLKDTATGPHRLMEIYKDGAADPASGKASTIRFRDLGRGENRMTGMLYECFPATGDYTVLNPDFFLFQGTGATKGSTYPDIIAVEVDRAYPVASTPRPLEVVALSPTRCGDARTVSTSTYYTVPSGAGVFSVGSIGWIFRGMSRKTTPRTATFVRKVTSTLLREMAKGPMGATHPATDNLKKLGLKTVNTTGSA